MSLEKEKMRGVILYTQQERRNVRAGRVRYERKFKNRMGLS